MGAANNSYLQYTYVGNGVTTRTWTVTAPATPGTYEFRLFENYGYTRLATSPAVTVLPGPPVISSLAPAGAPVGGAAFTLTVNGTGFTAGSIVRWNGADRVTTFSSANRLQASIPASDLAVIGTAQVTVFTPTTGTSSARPFSVQTAPVLSVSSTTVTTGTAVTVTLTGGFGGAADWLSFANTGAPNSSYVQYTYVGSGVTTRTWTVTVTGPGTYEFRLFSDGYNRLATSATITATAGAPPVLTVSTDDGGARHASHGDAHERLRRRDRLAGAGADRHAEHQLHSVQLRRRQRDHANLDVHDAEHAGDV